MRETVQFFKLKVCLTITEKVFEFAGAVRGFLYFQKIWQPKEAEELTCFHGLDYAFALVLSRQSLIMVLLSDMFLEKSDKVFVRP